MKKKLSDNVQEKRKAAGDKWFAWFRAKYPPVVMLPDAEPDGLLSKADAVAQGIRWYRTGEVLVCGHAGWQYVLTDRCRSCAAGR